MIRIFNDLIEEAEMKDLEDIINEVGGQGKYQRRLLYYVLSPLFFLLPLSWMSEVFYLNAPPHWCYHPMTKGLNDTQLKAVYYNRY